MPIEGEDQSEKRRPESNKIVLKHKRDRMRQEDVAWGGKIDDRYRKESKKKGRKSGSDHPL